MPHAEYIVVGAGSAGAVIASRLSEDTSASVILFEAGSNYRSSEAPPALHGLDIAPIVRLGGYHWPRLFERAHVADASVFPRLPRAAPHLSVVMLAERVARGMPDRRGPGVDGVQTDQQRCLQQPLGSERALPMLLEGGPVAYIDTLARFKATLPVRTIVSGHGPLGSARALEVWMRYLAELLVNAERVYRLGQSAEAAVEVVPLGASHLQPWWSPLRRLNALLHNMHRLNVWPRSSTSAANERWQQRIARVGFSINEAEDGTQSFVGLGCPSIAADEHLASATSSGRDQGIVCRAAADADLDKARDEGAVLVAVQCNIRVWEPSGEKVASEVRGNPVRWW